MELLNQFADWDRICLIKKPIIGAVKGFVFGGGFELALCCDILIAASGTQFSFPEVQSWCHARCRRYTATDETSRSSEST